MVEVQPRYTTTKFEDNLANGFGEEVENVIVGIQMTTAMDDDGDGRKVVTKAELTDTSAELKMKNGSNYATIQTKISNLQKRVNV